MTSMILETEALLERASQGDREAGGFGRLIASCFVLAWVSAARGEGAETRYEK